MFDQRGKIVTPSPGFRSFYVTILILYLFIYFMYFFGDGCVCVEGAGGAYYRSLCYIETRDTI